VFYGAARRLAVSYGFVRCLKVPYGALNGALRCRTGLGPSVVRASYGACTKSDPYATYSSDGGQMRILKSSFFVVAVFLWPNRMIIRINMHQEATRPPPPPPTWSLGGGVKVDFFCFIP
jgi:hypothetical protein